MPVIKNLFTGLVVCIYSLSVAGCATTYERGNGVVISAKKIQQRDFKLHDGTKNGAAIGGVTGAVGGASAGGIVGLALGALGHGSVPVLIGATLGGAVAGAAIVGVVGAAAGAGLGYVGDIANSEAGMYQFVVRPDSNAKPITITQYSSIIPVNTQVHILEKDDGLFIKRK